MKCERCGRNLRRLPRITYLQKEVFSKVGYYPWECPLCRKLRLIRQRSLADRRSEPTAPSTVDLPV